MSLPLIMQATEGYSTFNVLNRSIIDDTRGGYTEGYTIGAQFEGVIVLDDSLQAQEAQKAGVTGVYTLTVDKSIDFLKWHTVICRKGNINDAFRVVTKDEKSTPSTSKLNLREVRLEEYEVQNG